MDAWLVSICVTWCPHYFMTHFKWIGLELIQFSPEFVFGICSWESKRGADENEGGPSLYWKKKTDIPERLSRNFSSGQINNLVNAVATDSATPKAPENHRGQTNVDDRRILFLVKQNPLTTYSQVENAQEDIIIRVIKEIMASWIKGFTSRRIPLVTLKNRKARLTKWWEERAMEKDRKCSWSTSAVHHDGSCVLAWVSMAAAWEPGHWCLLMMWSLIEVAGCVELYFLPRFCQMRQDWWDGASQYRWIMTWNTLPKHPKSF